MVTVKDFIVHLFRDPFDTIPRFNIDTDGLIWPWDLAMRYFKCLVDLFIRNLLDYIRAYLLVEIDELLSDMLIQIDCANT